MAKLFEHSGVELSLSVDDVEKLLSSQHLTPKYFRNDQIKGQCYTIKIEDNTKIMVSANYYVGVDWLISDECYIYVAPKVNQVFIDNFIKTAKDTICDELYIAFDNDNQSNFDVDYLAMLSQCIQHPEVSKELNELLHIDWSAPEILIEQNQDLLTPLLVTYFLNLLKRIIKKGLRKSYYINKENLNNRIKGKILIGQNIKRNVLKNHFTKAYCQYQEFGTNSVENLFIKKVLQFSSAYIDNHQELFGNDAAVIKQLLNYCYAPFDSLSGEVDDNQLKHIKPNPFYAEYTEVIRVGKLLLKRLSYSISNASTVEFKTPPYWINMPLLFELYVYCFLKKAFPIPEMLKYQFSTFGNKLDFLINDGDTKMVVDAKYKLKYASKRVIHDDIRQIAGYARLTKVHKDLHVLKPELIDCLIIYPDVKAGYTLEDFSIDKKEKIANYEAVYSLGIMLPIKK